MYKKKKSRICCVAWDDEYECKLEQASSQASAKKGENMQRAITLQLQIGCCNEENTSMRLPVWRKERQKFHRLSINRKKRYSICYNGFLLRFDS